MTTTSPGPLSYCALCGRTVPVATWFLHAAVEHGISVRDVQAAPVYDLTDEDDDGDAQ